MYACKEMERIVITCTNEKYSNYEKHTLILTHKSN